MEFADAWGKAQLDLLASPAVGGLHCQRNGLNYEENALLKAGSSPCGVAYRAGRRLWSRGRRPRRRTGVYSASLRRTWSH